MVLVHLWGHVTNKDFFFFPNGIEKWSFTSKNQLELPAGICYSLEREGADCMTSCLGNCWNFGNLPLALEGSAHRSPCSLQSVQRVASQVVLASTMGLLIRENCSRALPSRFPTWSIKGCWWQLYINCVLWRAGSTWFWNIGLVLPEHPFDTSASSRISNAVIIAHGTSLVTWALWYFTGFWAAF